MTMGNDVSDRLEKIHLDVQSRVDVIRDQHPDWLCRRGCDGCCRRLAEPPRLTEAEWNRIWSVFLDLSPALKRTIEARVKALDEKPLGPYSCPFLDHSKGACMIYEARPVACRTYGFYRSRDQGLYCKDIEREVNLQALDDVVWGNHDAVDDRLKGLGSQRALTEWFLREP